MDITRGWHPKRPDDAIGQSIASRAVKDPWLKGVCREVKAWHREETLREAICKTVVMFKHQTQHFGDASIQDDYQESQQPWSRYWKSLEYKLCVARAEAEKWYKTLGGTQKFLSESQTLDIELFILMQFVLICSDCDCALLRTLPWEGIWFKFDFYKTP